METRDWVNANFRLGFFARLREYWQSWDKAMRNDLLSAALIVWAIGAACGAILISFAVKAED